MEQHFSKPEKKIYSFLCLITILGGVFFGYIVSEVKNFSGLQNLKKFQPSVPTRVYDVNGELIAEIFKEQRDIVDFDDVPKAAVNAFLATEDQEFYEHFGINPLAISRAMAKNVLAGRIKQGGSTITQQLAKRLFTQGEKKFSRKILEAILTLQIEKYFSKNEILEMYFNQIYLGHGCYGLNAASKLFFNKEAKYLTAAEASVLAALPSAPGRYSPLDNPHNAYEKNPDILGRMVNEGYLTKEYADKIYTEFWPKYIDSILMEFPTKTAYTKIENNAPHFVDYVRQILESRFGREAVYEDGLIVYTTLDLKKQFAAQKYLEEGVERQDIISSRANSYSNGGVDRGLFGTYYTLRSIFSLPNVLIKNDIDTILRKKIIDDEIDEMDILTFFSDSANLNKTAEIFRTGTALSISSSLKVQGALVSLDPATGYIISMVGGSDFSVDNQFNRAVQARRQPGSSFKPFIYGAGIESRVINPGTGISDAPLLNIAADGETWSPDNYSGDFSGMVRVRRALAASINTVSVRIYDMVGPERIIDYAAKMLKIPPSRLGANPSLALGTAEITPFEMAQGYAIYANEGRDVIPFAIRYVLDRDENEIANIEEEVANILAIKEKENTIQIIGKDVAYVMRSLMQTVVDAGTAASTIRGDCDFHEPAAGKTGSTTSFADAWFCGFTPAVVTVVWVGYDKPFMTLGRGQAGSNVAAPIWGHYMKDIYNGMPSRQFPPEPEGIIKIGFCAYTGKIPGPNCKELSGDISVKGGGPKEWCDGSHGKMKSILEKYLEKEGLSGGNRRSGALSD